MTCMSSEMVQCKHGNLLQQNLGVRTVLAVLLQSATDKSVAPNCYISLWEIDPGCGVTGLPGK